MIEHMLMVGNDGHEEDIASLREDAERYRWLRRQQAIGCWPQVVDGLHRLVGDELDATVDDAMRGERTLPSPSRLN